jgi:hypothetical protein
MYITNSHPFLMPSATYQVSDDIYNKDRIESLLKENQSLTDDLKIAKKTIDQFRINYTKLQEEIKFLKQTHPSSINTNGRRIKLRKTS